MDEYISILAMQSIVERGIPLLPSGLLYGPKALLHSYIGALTVWMFDSSEFAIRFLSVMAGMMAVAFIYKVGRNWFGSGIGLIAATTLACLPAAIEWSGRARMYSLFQLLTLIGGYLLITGFLVDNDRRMRILGVIFMLLAVYTHTLSLIVLGGVIAGIVIARLVYPNQGLKRGISISFREIFVGVIFILFVLLLQPMGGAWGAQVRLSDTAQGYLNIQERISYLMAYTHQFVMWPLWPLTIFYVLGFINLLFRLIKKSPLLGDQIALSLYSLNLFIWLATSVLSKLHDDRYLFAMLPFYILLTVREIFLFSKTVLESDKLRFIRINDLIISKSLSFLIIILLISSAVQLVNKEDTFGFVPAYLYVRDNWRNGDVVATCSPAPSHLVLNRTDYYMIQYGAESKNGVDIWTGAPIIDTVEKFKHVLTENMRVWFVIEKLCWERQFDADFQAFVYQNMKVALDQKGILVFVSNSDRMEH